MLTVISLKSQFTETTNQTPPTSTEAWIARTVTNNEKAPAMMRTGSFQHKIDE